MIGNLLANHKSHFALNVIDKLMLLGICHCIIFKDGSIDFIFDSMYIYFSV